jgi:hypothetical protein
LRINCFASLRASGQQKQFARTAGTIVRGKPTLH